MFRPPTPRTRPPLPEVPADLAHWRQALLQGILKVALPLGTLLVVLGTAVAYYKRDMAMAITNFMGLGTLALIHRLHGLSPRVRGAGLVLIMVGVGVSFLVNRIGAFGLVWLSAAPLLAALLLGRWVAMALLAAVSAGVFGMAYSLNLPLEAVPLEDLPEVKWSLLGLNFFVANLIVGLGAAVMLRWLDQAVHQAQSAQAVLKQQAERDHLTGLPNRRVLLRQTDAALAALPQETGLAALLFIDLDNFKNVNDTHGHLEGDRLLVQVAQRMAALVQAPSLVARTGGDEFVVLLQGLPATTAEATEHARLVAERLRTALLSPFELPAGPYHTSISVGMTLLPRPGLTPDDVLREADTAMYRAKAMGRNCVVLFEPAMQAQLRERLQLERDLQEALATQGLSVAVQSQVNGLGAVVGAELLMRWHHPVRGPLSPAQFIPVAEETGLILPMGEWVLGQACVLAKTLENQGRHCPVSVNISPRQFHQPGFVERVQFILATHAVSPRQLVLEVTEGLLISDVETTVDSMSRLAAVGFRFSVDDFGTGYSSLSYLKRLPLHELKIDRSFVDGLPAQSNDAAIVSLILAMAAELKLQVVAEGVETPEQAAFLQAHGCHAMQGFLFSRPLPPTDWLATLG